MTIKEDAKEMIVCRDVQKWFDEFHVLRGITTTVREGEVVVIIGPSGSGKSTFIRCLNRLEEHQEGDIIVDGIELSHDIRNIEAVRREVGMVFQQFNLFPHLTVMENITLAPTNVRRWPKEKANEVATQLLGASQDTGAGPQVSRPALRRAAAAGSHRTRAGYAAQDHAVRRADFQRWTRK